MKIGMQINGPDAQSVEAIGNQLCKVLVAIADNRIDRETGLAAIRILEQIGVVSVRNCTFGIPEVSP